MWCTPGQLIGLITLILALCSPMILSTQWGAPALHWLSMAGQFGLIFGIVLWPVFTWLLIFAGGLFVLFMFIGTVKAMWRSW